MKVEWIGTAATVACALVAIVFLWVLLGGVRVINQVERGIVFRFGKARRRIRQPGLAVVLPLIDRVRRVNIQIVTMPCRSRWTRSSTSGSWTR